MADRLFSATPALTDVNDGSPIQTATTFGVTVAGQITHARFYTPASVGTVTATLYSLASDVVPSATLAQKVFAAVTPGAYNEQAIDTPVSVSPGVAYRISIHNSNGHYVATAGVFSGGNVTSGRLVAWQVSTDPVGIGNISNGAYEYGSIAFPNEPGSGACYFADVVYTEGGPVSGTAAAVLGAVAGSATGKVRGYGSASAWGRSTRPRADHIPAATSGAGGGTSCRSLSGIARCAAKIKTRRSCTVRMIKRC